MKREIGLSVLKTVFRRSLAVALTVVGAWTAGAAEDLYDVLKGQGFAPVGEVFTLTRDIDLTVSSVTVTNKAFTIDLNGHSFCVRAEAEGVPPTWRQTLTITNSSSTRASAYLRYNLSCDWWMRSTLEYDKTTGTWVQGESVEGRAGLVICDRVNFGSVYFGIENPLPSFVGDGSIGGLFQLKSGATYNDGGWYPQTSETPSFTRGQVVLERGSFVCGAMREDILAGSVSISIRASGDRWPQDGCVVADEVDAIYGLYEIIDAPVRVKANYVYQYWPWTNTVHVGYDINKLDPDEDYQLKMRLEINGKWAEWDWDDLSAGSRGITVGADILDLCFDRELYSTDTKLVLTLSKLDDDEWQVVNTSELTGFLIDTRAEKVMVKGETRYVYADAKGIFRSSGTTNGAIVVKNKAGSSYYNIDKGWSGWQVWTAEVGGTNTLEHGLNAVFAKDGTLTSYLLDATAKVVVLDSVAEAPIYTASFTYDGLAKVGLKRGAGYTVSGDAIATDAGTYTATATLMEGLKWPDGTTAPRTYTWTIERCALTDNTYIRLSQNAFVYDGTEKRPTVTIGSLEEGVHYTLVYENNVEIGVGKVIVTGIGNFKGTTTRTFAITDASGELPGGEYSYMYNGQEKTLFEESDGYTISGRNSAKDVGKYEVTLTLKPGYVWKDGTYAPKTVNWEITPGIIDVCDLTTKVFTYDGTAHEPAIKYAGKLDKRWSEFDADGNETIWTRYYEMPATDYEVSYSENVNAGLATVTVTGINNCVGSASVTFRILPKSIWQGDMQGKCQLIWNGQPMVDGGDNFPVYDGTEKSPEVSFTDASPALVLGRDYTVVYSNNVNATGQPVAIITGIGNYAGAINYSYPILPFPIDGLPVTLEYTTCVYDGTDHAPKATVAGLPGEGSLIFGYRNSVNVGTATVVVYGFGNYTGQTSANFTITAKSIAGLAATLGYETTVYDGTEKKPTVTVKDGSKTLVPGTDYEVAYSANTEVGTATVTITGKGNYGETLVKTFAITPKPVSEVSATLEYATITYDGGAKTPGVTVTDGGKTLEAGKDYTVEYINNVEVGTATAVITGKGNYTGTKTLTFKINGMPLPEATLEYTSTVYDGMAKTPVVTIPGLTEGEDFTVQYLNNVDATRADYPTAVVITGIGHYAGTQTVPFTIERKPVDVPTVAENLTFNGMEQNGVAPTAGTGFTVTGTTKATDVGFYHATATLTSNNYCWNDQTTASKELNWSIAASQKEGDANVVDNDAQVELLLPKVVDDGPVEIKPTGGFEPTIPEGYATVTNDQGVITVWKIYSSNVYAFVLDTNDDLTNRTLTAREAIELTHSATAWGEGEGTAATVTYTRNGGETRTLGSFADDATAAWTPEGDGLYVFAHAPGAELTATFKVEATGPEGEGSEELPYLIYSVADFASAMAYGRPGADGKIHCKLMAEIDGTFTVGDQQVVLDMNNHTVDGGNDGEGHGLSGVVVSGAGTIEFTGTGVIKGGDGAVSGAKAVAIADPTKMTVGANVTLIDGLSGDGSSDHPYLVGNREEFEAACAAGTNDPVWIKLTNSIPETVTIDEEKNVKVDLNGHSIVGGQDADGNGLPGIDVTGTGDLTLVNTDTAHEGLVKGGDGADATATKPAGNGGAGVKTLGGELNVGEKVVVQGGKGGNAFTNGDGGKGGNAVSGDVGTNDGDLIGGNGGNGAGTGKGGDGAPAVTGGVDTNNGTIVDGFEGDGTAAHPFIVYSAQELEDIVALQAKAGVSDIYVQLGANIAAATIRGDINTHIDMNGHDITATGTDASGNGLAGLTVGNEGTGTLTLTGAGTIAASDGIVGGKAVVGRTPTKDETVILKDGLSGDGSAEYPYEVATAEEFEQAMEKAMASEPVKNPVNVKLIGDIVGTVTIDENANVRLDTNGHDMTGGANGEGSGQPAINVTGTGDLDIFNSQAATDPSVIKGGDGTDGHNGAPGVKIATGTADVGTGVTIQGGNGGDSLDEEPGKGAEGVEGNVKTGYTGEVLPGHDGTRGDGTQAHPFVAYTPEELEAIVNATAEGADVYVIIGADFDHGATLAKNVKVHLDLNQKTLAGRDGTDGAKDGESALTLTAGTLELYGTGTVKGGNGADDLGGTNPGKGAKAVTLPVGTELVKAETDTLIDGRDGRIGDGSEAYPYLVGSREEFEAACAEGGTNVWIKLTNSIPETVTIDESKDVKVDLNGKSITGGRDANGNGLPGINVTGTGDLKLFNTDSENEGLVKGGDGADGTATTPAGNGGAGVKTNGGLVEVGANTTVQGGKGGRAVTGNGGQGGNAVVGDVDPNVGNLIGGNGGGTGDPEGDAGKGGKAVTGEVSHNTGTVIDGFMGDGTAESPYIVYSAKELEYVVSFTSDAGKSDVYVKLGADLTPASIKGDVNTHIDMNGHDIAAEGVDGDGNGKDALTVGAGDGTLTLTGTGNVIGSDGAIGGKAIVGRDEVTKAETVNLIDGRNGDGTAAHPYEVATVEEFEQALADAAAKEPAQDQVWIKLVGNIVGTVTIDENANVKLDTNGHDMTGGQDAAGNGQPAIKVTGSGDLDIVNTKESTDPSVIKGGDGADGDTSGKRAGKGGAGIEIAPGKVNVGEYVTVKGGNGGNDLDEDAGLGGKGVEGTVEDGSKGTVEDGENGTRGNGTALYPFVAYTPEELEEIVNVKGKALAGSEVYVKIGDDFDLNDGFRRAIALDGDVKAHIDLGSHTITGFDGTDDGAASDFDGLPAILVGEGAGSLEFYGTGTVKGGDGADNFGGTPGQGAEAVVSGVEVTQGENVTFVKGTDGRNGDGTAEHPYIVYTAEELETVVNGTLPGDDVYVQLGADITDVVLDGRTDAGGNTSFDVNAHIDLNGHSIEAGADENGDGKPGITIGKGKGSVELTGSGLVAGGDATAKGGKGGPAIASEGGIVPTVGDNVTLRDGLSGTGTEDDPYVVGTKDEFEHAIETGTEPIYIVLDDDIFETLPIDYDKDVVLDLNGHNVTGDIDPVTGDGKPGIEVTKGGNLTLTGDGTVTGGAGRDSVDGAAGDGGNGVVMGGGTLKIDEDALVKGGNGGDTESGTVGKGGKGVPEGTKTRGDGSPDNISDGADGQSFKKAIEDAFGGEGNVDVEKGEDGEWIIVLKRDITGPVEIPDNLGKLTVDMNGHDITGPNGSAGEDGGAAIVIKPTGKGGEGSHLNFIGEGTIAGGNGGDSTTGPGGNGGTAIVFENGADLPIAIGPDVTVRGGKGGQGGPGGNGGTAVDGDIAVNEGTILGGEGGAGNPSTDGEAANGGNGGDTVTGDIGTNDGTVKGGTGGTGGDTDTGTTGRGGFGGDQGLPTQGDDGKNGTTKDGQYVILKEAFGGDENVDVTKNDDGTYTVELKKDIDGPVIVPDNVGDFVIDLKGHKINGRDGSEPGEDGTPALVIEETGKAENPPTVIIRDTVGGGSVNGGDGANGNGDVLPGKGAPGVVGVEPVVEAPAVVTDGRDGGPGLVVTGVRARYPWNGYIDVDYTIAGNAEGYALMVLLTDPATGNVTTGETFVAAANLATGDHRLTWNAAADAQAALVSKDTVITVILAPDGQEDAAAKRENLAQSKKTPVDFREGTETNPRAINTIDDLWPITYEAGATVTGDGKTFVTSAAAEGSFEWTPTTAGKVKLTQTVGSQTVESWFLIDPSVVGKEKFKLPVEFDEGEEPEEIVVPREWLEEHLGDITGKTDGEIREELNEKQPNGLTKWQNEAIGWTGQEPSVNDITTNPQTKQMHIEGFGEGMKISSTIPDVKAMFVLKKLIHTNKDGTKTFGDDLENDTWEDVPGKVSDTAAFDVDLGPNDPTGLYRIFLRFEPEEE